VVVVTNAAYVVVDGHKRVRCLRSLHRDTVLAVVWDMPEAEALIFGQLLRANATDSAFEHGWLLRTYMRSMASRSTCWRSASIGP
jgi:hypothetical protein